MSRCFAEAETKAVPAHRVRRPLVKSTTGKRESSGEMMSDVQSSCSDRDATRARAAQLRAGVIA